MSGKHKKVRKFHLNKSHLSWADFWQTMASCYIGSTLKLSFLYSTLACLLSKLWIVLLLLTEIEKQNNRSDWKILGFCFSLRWNAFGDGHLGWYDSSLMSSKTWGPSCFVLYHLSGITLILMPSRWMLECQSSCLCLIKSKVSVWSIILRYFLKVSVMSTYILSIIILSQDIS